MPTQQELEEMIGDRHRVERNRDIGEARLAEQTGQLSPDPTVLHPVAKGKRDLPGILLRSLSDPQQGTSSGGELSFRLSSETEQLRHEFCFSHHIFFRYPSYSSLANHVHRFDAFQRSSRTREGFVTLR